jgi:hypothetical protein
MERGIRSGAEPQRFMIEWLRGPIQSHRMGTLIHHIGYLAGDRQFASVGQQSGAGAAPNRQFGTPEAVT